MTMTKTLPACLFRTAADDRAEAHNSAACTRLEREREREVLAAIQRREAEALFDYAIPLLKALPTYLFGVHATAVEAVCGARYWAKGGEAEGFMTLAQRATLLDAARSLVRLALEIAPEG